MKERIKILQYSRENPNLIINSSSEFYGACRHKPKFQWYAKTTPLSVLMMNTSSERVHLTLNIPPLSNISTNICTYVEKESPTDIADPSEKRENSTNISTYVWEEPSDDKIYLLGESDIFENGRIQDLNYFDV